MKPSDLKETPVKCETKEEAREVLQWIVDEGEKLYDGEHPTKQLIEWNGFCFVGIRKIYDHDFGVYEFADNNDKRITFQEWKEKVGRRRETLYTLEELGEKEIVINARTREEVDLCPHGERGKERISKRTVVSTLEGRVIVIEDLETGRITINRMQWKGKSGHIETKTIWESEEN